MSGYKDGVWTLEIEGGSALAVNMAGVITSHPKFGKDGPSGELLDRLLAAIEAALDNAKGGLS